MQVINWLELQPPPADLDALREHLRQALPLRRVCRLLVETTLRAYPWTGRADLISCYHPSQTYKQGQRVALLIPDSQNIRHTVWLLAQVKSAGFAQNPVQGRFQVLTLEIHGRQIQMAGGVANASYPEPDLSNHTSEEFDWLVEWVSDTYAASLQATVKKLIQTGQLRGQLAGETFLPEQVSTLSPELLQPCFARISAARPWIILEEIVKGLPDLAQLERETVLTLLRATLKEGPYRCLGGGRWTTLELFNQLNREVPCGLPTPPIRSKANLWTKQDEKDLAGYDSKFMPAEVQRALEELGMGESPSEPDASPWRPPKDPLRLPALNYLHSTQAYFPVRAVLGAFAPDVEMVFIQFIHGDHQPFLLDRDHGLLKAVQPEELHSKILEEDIPAGTYLWLEYQGSESYRIAPRPLPFKRRVPCKLASLDHGQLHIEHSHTSMRYAGDPSLFKAKIRFEEIEGLFAESSRVHRSVREAMIYAVQEISATDPDHRAHWMDIFNAVFLQRMCSPSSVSLLLYTQPCFESLGGGYFRYKPMPDTVMNTPKQTSRLSRLWDDLLSDPVAPRPIAKERMTIGARLEVSYPAASFASDLALPTLLSLPETEPETSVRAASYVVVEEDTPGKTALQEEEWIEPILLSDHEPESFTLTPTDATGLLKSTWRDSLERLSHSLAEPDNADLSALSLDEANSEREASFDVPLEAAHEASLSFSTPFRWEPKPAWVNPPIQSTPPLSNLVDPRRFVNRPRIPIRPLHKQPFYKRLIFYLRRWLGRSSRKKV